MTKKILAQIKVFAFDLDGTIVDSQLDFDHMRRDLGLGSNTPILEAVENYSSQTKKKQAHAIIRRHELLGIEKATLMPGFLELADFLKSKSIPIAIQTRNSSEVAQLTLEKFNLNIPLVLSRDNCPPKPNPEGLFRIMEKFGAEKKQTIYIGDSSYDINTAMNAGVLSALFMSDYNKGFNCEADFKIKDFREMIYV